MPQALPPTFQPSVFPVESSMRHAPSRPPATFDVANAVNPSTTAALAFPANGRSNNPFDPMPMATPPIDDMLPPWFDDPSNQQTLAELLGESGMIGTDDPFAFLSGEGWDEAAF